MPGGPFLNPPDALAGLAQVWFRAGAVRLDLRDGARLLASFPPGGREDSRALEVRSVISGWSLRIHGLDDPSLLPAAEALLGLLDAGGELNDLTAALVETQDRLVAIYELARATRRMLDIPSLLELLTQEALRMLDVEGAFAVLVEKDRPAVLHLTSSRPLPEGRLLEAAERFRRDPLRNTVRTASETILLVGMPVRDGVFAALGIFKGSGAFATPEIKLARAIAGQIGAQLENAFLHKEALERARLDAEINIAHRLQLTLLPQSLPVMEGLDIFASSIPVYEVGGDFFDLRARAPDSLVFSVGDVTGKGLPAALMMAMTHTIMKSAVQKMPFDHPHQVLDRLNTDLFDDSSNIGMFITVFIGQFDCSSRRLSFSNAGQSPIIHLPAGGEAVLLQAEDVPIGVVENYEYCTQHLQLAPGDILLVGSDGFPESGNAAGEMFGYERMKESLAQARAFSASEIVGHLLADLNAFCGAQAAGDDRTILVIKVREAPAGTDSMQVEASYEAIRQPCERLRLLLSAGQVNEATVNACELALQELLTNLVEHAYAGAGTGSIEIDLSLERDRIHITTRDRGRSAPIDLERVSMPDPADLSEGGYGLAVIRTLMDTVTFASADGVNTWTLSRRR